MEEHLLRNDYFAGDYSIADIALFAYTHVSHEGGFTLDNDARIRAWLQRVKAQPGFVPMGHLLSVIATENDQREDDHPL